MTHWECWWEWGFKFSLLKDRLKKVKYFNPEKIDSLYHSIETRACHPHDISFLDWWWIKEFYLSNYKFCLEVMDILHWTTTFSRIVIFTVLYIGLNTVGIKYFNWTNFWTNEN